MIATRKRKDSSISGRVTDESGAPFSVPVQVTAINVDDPSQTQTTLSDNNGAYSFKSVRPGRYELAVHSPADFRKLPKVALVVTAGEARAGIDFRLIPTAPV